MKLWHRKAIVFGAFYALFVVGDHGQSIGRQRSWFESMWRAFAFIGGACVVAVIILLAIAWALGIEVRRR